MSSESPTNPTPIPTAQGIPEGFTEFLPPWSLEAEAWWIFPSIPLSWQSKKLPRGALDPLESDRLEDLQATYMGGLGSVQLLRYHTSPVGPYDELLYVPGKMKYKVGNSTISGLSITRIYVSSPASIVNGRRNWNIPKQLARFEFHTETPNPLSPVVAAVYPALNGTGTAPEPEFAAEPVFRARLVPSRLLPNFPLNVAHFPRAIVDPRLFQAPLTSASPVGGAVVGTEKWCTVAPEFKGRVRVMYPEPGLGGKFGDGVGFPDVRPLLVGVWWPKANIRFPAAEILNPENSEDKKAK
ncbi:hypothetical protein CTheo_6109 [Ceratobasidium theobromae]|uniref:Acetoacetate decarboxylase n=1 Tax=Ceratobasidium theobromae TaxID=1582974 RepID=A0A5N5QG68_9AGAM|nr:hypothetical protein CTheo_6109 [Ceratobasidium theobromae]